MSLQHCSRFLTAALTDSFIHITRRFYPGIISEMLSSNLVPVYGLSLLRIVTSIGSMS